MPISSGFSQQLNGRAQGSARAALDGDGCSALHVLQGMMRSPGLMLSSSSLIV